MFSFRLNPDRRSTFYGLTVAVLVCTLLLYLPGLTAGFTLDDWVNIRLNPTLAVTALDWGALWAAAWSREAGQLGRPISMLSFALNHLLTGYDPYSFRLTNVFVHLINGLLILVLSQLLLSGYGKHLGSPLSRVQVRWLSLAVAAVWLFHPLNLTGVLYIVQRMTSLATLFTLAGLVVYCRGRLRMMDGFGGIGQVAISVLVFGPLAILTKENGALLLAYMFVIELTLFRFRCNRPVHRKLLYGLYAVTLAIPFLAVAGFLISQPEFVAGRYGTRDFTLEERLMTEGRVLWFYLRLILVPDIRQMGLYHDDFSLSQGLLEPPITILAVTGILGLLATALVLRTRLPVLSFGVLWFLAGHSLESTVLPLELVHEHRNYLPSFGILFMLLYGVSTRSVLKKSLGLRRLAPIPIAALFAIGTATRAAAWSNDLTFAMAQVENHPNSARANFNMGHAYHALYMLEAKPEFYDEARNYYRRAAEANPNSTNGLRGLVELSYTADRPVESEWLVELQRRLATPPFDVDGFNQLKQLVDCQTKGACALEHRNMDALFEAALRNPSLKDRVAAALLNLHGRYLFSGPQDYIQGLDLFLQAANRYPREIQLQLDVVSGLIATKQYSAAEQALDSVKKQDRWRKRSRRIQLLEADLMRARAKQ